MVLLQETFRSSFFGLLPKWVSEGHVLVFGLLVIFVIRYLANGIVGDWSKITHSGREKNWPSATSWELIMSFFETSISPRHFGGLIAVNDLSFQVEPGEIFGLIGPNGSGKTTVFNLINGYYPITSGTIRFQGKGAERPSHLEDLQTGVGRTFQIVKPLRRMTVLENVMTSAFNDRHAEAGVPGKGPGGA